jgi:serine phosphatase RsbU (regulator of sigma subunit)
VILRPRTDSGEGSNEYETIRLDSNGTVIGLLPEACYRQSSIKLRPGDIFCAFTDGVTEAEDVAGEEFGQRRLETVLMEHAEATAAESCREALAQLDRFTAGVVQRDDITLVVGKVR